MTIVIYDNDTGHIHAPNAGGQYTTPTRGRVRTLHSRLGSRLSGPAPCTHVLAGLLLEAHARGALDALRQSQLQLVLAALGRYREG